MKTREYYYGAEAFGAEWEEMKKKHSRRNAGKIQELQCSRRGCA